MSFYIQASNPRTLYSLELEDESLSDAIESAFVSNTENAILVWNYISIPLSYKYDISYMIEDILNLLSSLQKMAKGKMEIHWLPDTFRCNWLISWDADQLRIEAKWECTVGHLEGLLNEKPVITLTPKEFLSEWKEILFMVIKGLKNCGYDEYKIKGMQKLLEQYSHIEELGVLYRD
ncbi:MAG: hypothetical protein NC307_14835 [Roseburia sp.]|nr:hypothetical protein [Roseburia sp.]